MLHRRFIPAGAGNTAYPKLFASMRPVYPRWRGEHRICELDDLPNLGLSPLARGTPDKRVSAAHAGRFIPAGAGNTRHI